MNPPSSVAQYELDALPLNDFQESLPRKQSLMNYLLEFAIFMDILGLKIESLLV